MFPVKKWVEMESETTAVLQSPVYKGGVMVLLFSHTAAHLVYWEIQIFGIQGVYAGLYRKFWPNLHEAWSLSAAYTVNTPTEKYMFREIHEISKVCHISELALTKCSRKRLWENLLVLHLGFVAVLGLAASLCSWSDQLWSVEHAEVAWLGSAASWAVPGPAGEAPDPFSSPPAQTGGAWCPGSAGWLACGCSHRGLAVEVSVAAAAEGVAAARG